MSEISVRVQEKGQVTIPRRIREKLKLKKGDLVTFQETDSGVMVKPVLMVGKDDRRDELNAIVHSIREKFTSYSVEQIEVIVNNAIQESKNSR